MKVFVFLLALLFPGYLLADPAPLTYRVKATAVLQRPVKSCGASERMLKDRHRIVARGDTYYIDGMRWATLEGSTLPGEAYLAFHQGQKVWLTMWLQANDTKVIGLYALTDDGLNCQDVVRLEGVRL